MLKCAFVKNSNGCIGASTYVPLHISSVRGITQSGNADIEQELGNLISR